MYTSVILKVLLLCIYFSAFLIFYTSLKFTVVELALLCITMDKQIRTNVKFFLCLRNDYCS